MLVSEALWNPSYATESRIEMHHKALFNPVLWLSEGLNCSLLEPTYYAAMELVPAS